VNAIRKWLTRTAHGVVPVLLLAVLIARLGLNPFTSSLKVLSPWPIAAALLLGAVATTGQAMRWRTVALARHHDRDQDSLPELTRTRAVAECYRSTLLNSVLPGGVLGDAIRAWRHRAPSGVRPSAVTVLGERVIGTAVLLLAVAAVGFPLETWLGTAALAGALVAALIALPALRRLSPAGRCAAVGWSVLSLASLVAKFFVVTSALGTVHRAGDVVTLALITLAGMSVPFGIGGFGPRETVAALAFAALGLSADAGVTTAAGYGVLAAISATPGVAVMLFDLLSGHRRLRAGSRTAISRTAISRTPIARTPVSRQVELHADVVTEGEPAGRRAQAVRQPESAPAQRVREAQRASAGAGREWPIRARFVSR
jgi:glycosyltransferase 2 family protein